MVVYSNMFLYGPSTRGDTFWVFWCRSSCCVVVKPDHMAEMGSVQDLERMTLDLQRQQLELEREKVNQGS